jgi:hypothetical protein
MHEQYRRHSGRQMQQVGGRGLCGPQAPGWCCGVGKLSSGAFIQYWPYAKHKAHVRFRLAA